VNRRWDELRFLSARWQGEDVACHGVVGFGRQLRWVAEGHLGAPPADLNSSASRGGSRLVSGGLAAVDVSDFAGDLGVHSDSSAGVLDGQ
jgi:hypothetical protein